jgi:hypothetical protein
VVDWEREGVVVGQHYGGTVTESVRQSPSVSTTMRTCELQAALLCAHVLLLCSLGGAFRLIPTRSFMHTQNHITGLNTRVPCALPKVGDVFVAEVDDFVGTVSDPLVQFAVSLTPRLQCNVRRLYIYVPTILD